MSANQPPYINNGGFMLSHRILNHVYDNLAPPVAQLSGRLLCFDQTAFFGNEAHASLAPFGYVYVPKAVAEGAPARVHIAIHGCMQGYSFVPYVAGRRDTANHAPYGNRYITTTGYNHLADANAIIVLYPQAEASEGGAMFNPGGCWDFWGYSCEIDSKLNYYARDAIQIKAIHGMLSRLGRADFLTGDQTDEYDDRLDIHYAIVSGGDDPLRYRWHAANPASGAPCRGGHRCRAHGEAAGAGW